MSTLDLLCARVKKQTPEPGSLPEREESSKGLPVLTGDLRT
jgi:hypothetical protein